MSSTEVLCPFIEGESKEEEEEEKRRKRKMRKTKN